MKYINFIGLLLLLTSCVSYKPAVDINYKGDTAVIADTFNNKTTGSARFYYVAEFNGKPLRHAISNSNAASAGQGLVLSARGESRVVPATQTKLKLTAQVHHSAPIGYLLNASSNYSVSGDIQFIPEPNAIYLVKGYLSEAYAAVWLEDLSGKIVSDIIEQISDNHEAALADKQKAFEKHNSGNGNSRLVMFANVNSGETSAIIEERLGKPDSVTSTESNPFSTRPARTTYHYNELGTITFNGKETLYVEFVTAVHPTNKLDTSDLGYQLRNYDSDRLQHFAKTLHNGNIKDIATLDLIASHLWHRRATDDKREIDALSWFCKILAQSGNARYKELLSTLDNESIDKKLKRYAQLSLDALPSDHTEQFDFRNSQI